MVNLVTSIIVGLILGAILSFLLRNWKVIFITISIVYIASFFTSSKPNSAKVVMREVPAQEYQTPTPTFTPEPTLTPLPTPLPYQGITLLTTGKHYNWQLAQDVDSFYAALMITQINKRYHRAGDFDIWYQPRGEVGRTDEIPFMVIPPDEDTAVLKTTSYTIGSQGIPKGNFLTYNPLKKTTNQSKNSLLRIYHGITFQIEFIHPYNFVGTLDLDGYRVPAIVQFRNWGAELQKLPKSAAYLKEEAIKWADTYRNAFHSLSDNSDREDLRRQTCVSMGNLALTEPFKPIIPTKYFYGTYAHNIDVLTLAEAEADIIVYKERYTSSESALPDVWRFIRENDRWKWCGSLLLNQVLK